MKIHKTQNLNSDGTGISVLNSTNNIKHSSSEFRLNNLAMRKQMLMCNEDTYESSLGMSFAGKRELVRKPVEAGKRSFSKRVANSKFVKKIINSDFFSGSAKVANEHEVMTQAGTALAICCVARPGTIMMFPGEKDRKDCAYAASHSISSGVLGFIVPALTIKPVVGGYNKVIKENAYKYLKESMMARRWPHLDLKSIKDATGKIMPMKEDIIDASGKKIGEKINWKDKTGRAFSTDFKNVRKIAKPKHISEVSTETLNKYFKDLDQSTISDINNLKTKDGKKAVMNIEDMYIRVKEEGGKAKFFPLEHVEEDILKDIYPDLEISSIGGKGASRLHPDNWRTKDGKKIDFTNDCIFISDYAESEDLIPLITGLTREEVKGGKKKIKYVCFQNNASGEHDLGTPITREMVEADWANAVQDKIGGWLPESIIAAPRAWLTIAILPFILKYIFHIEKSKKPKEAKAPAPAAQTIQMQPEVKATKVEAARKEVA